MLSAVGTKPPVKTPSWNCTLPSIFSPVLVRLDLGILLYQLIVLPRAAQTSKTVRTNETMIVRGIFTTEGDGGQGDQRAGENR